MLGTRVRDLGGTSLDGRKLIVVLYADMVGYSRLIRMDDVGTLRRLRVLRSKVIDPAIEQHGGRIVQTAGDSLLAVFDSIDGAVSCAVAVQQAVPAQDSAHPPDRAIRFRIGLNIGDAIADGADLHGEVVNVAARLQAECPPGGICVTRAVRDQVRDKLDLSFEELGALDLKNIGRPIEAFVLRSPTAETDSICVQQADNNGRPDFVFAECTIDLHRRELCRAGRIVHVEPQVYDLLVHLVRNRDRVVGKDELLDAIWNGRIVSEAALSSCINAARRAIGDDGGRQALIKTIHRRGFRFVGVVEEVATAPADEQPKSAERIVGAILPPIVASRKPSIAVLPFVNLSQEPDTDYFSYGLTEDVIRLLARHRWLDVLSRHSTVAFSRNTDPRTIGSELGIRYLVQGNVTKRGERVNITVDLVSAENGQQLWWKSYDISLANILDVQQAMAQQIAAVIEPELARLEREAAVRRPPVNLGAWDCYQRGLYHLWGFTTPGLEEGEAMFRRAIELDPSFARAHGALAYVTLQILVRSDPSERPALLEEALRHGRTAVALDDQDCMNLCVVGRVLCFRHEYEEAIAFLEEAIRINPSFAQAYFALGFTLIVSGTARDALEYLDRATELSPHDPHLASFHAIRAVGHFALGELDTAERFARMATRIPNANHWPFALLVSFLAIKQRSQDMRRAVGALLQRHPNYSVATARSDFFFCGDNDLVERFLEGLRRAGLPEAVGLGRGKLAGPATLIAIPTEEAAGRSSAPMA
jgi:class 3 adenylate cyclase/TolB-like protein/Tfp pilus assembly protein PilF